MLVWSRETPQEPGEYWVRGEAVKHIRPPVIVSVDELSPDRGFPSAELIGKTGFYTFIWDYPVLVTDLDLEWAGPIPQPIEPSSS